MSPCELADLLRRLRRMRPRRPRNLAAEHAELHRRLDEAVDLDEVERLAGQHPEPVASALRCLGIELLAERRP
jgi:hypothetical protein